MEPLKNNSNIVVGKKPCARDGHISVIIKDELIIFGGDRHQMSFNDIYKMNLKLAMKEIGNQWSVFPIWSNFLFVFILFLKEYPYKIICYFFLLILLSGWLNFKKLEKRNFEDEPYMFLWDRDIFDPFFFEY